ncbi:MAG: selenocysteine-specific translation elongation factor [Acidimicrobiales bacterium]
MTAEAPVAAGQAPAMHVVATAGHVDHGKSTLVLALTGMDPDRFAEEKARGLTIDLGFAWTILPSGAQLAFVDVPGHVRFLKNMLAGVGAVDACLFVVAAAEGWKPQSEEHLRILEVLGLRHGLIALTKVGLVDDDDRELARLEIAEAVEGTFLEKAEVIDLDTPTGVGLDDLRAALDRLVAETPFSADKARPRLWIDRVFAARGSGTVVTGTLAGGSLTVDDEVVVLPLGRRARVRALQSLQRSHTTVPPGSRVAVNLSGLSHDDLARGHAVVRPDQWHLTRTVDASLHVLAGLDHEVSQRGAYQAYLGSGEHPVRLRVLVEDAILPGEEGLVRLHLPVRVPLLPGDRYVLRESGRDETVGGGVVLDVAPVRTASKARPTLSADRVIKERGWVAADDLERMTGERRPPTVGRWVVSDGAKAATLQRVKTAVDAAGPLGLDQATLTDQERAVLPLVEGIAVDAGRARLADAVDPLASHPYVEALAAEPFTPPGPTGVTKAELHELVRRGLVVAQDGCYFAPSALDKAAHEVAKLLAGNPEGVTVAQVREALATTRKYALPLLNRLDADGVTRRRGDLRIGGPRLPDAT